MEISSDIRTQVEDYCAYIKDELLSSLGRNPYSYKTFIKHYKENLIGAQDFADWSMLRLHYDNETRKYVSELFNKLNSFIDMREVEQENLSRFTRQYYSFLTRTNDCSLSEDMFVESMEEIMKQYKHKEHIPSWFDSKEYFKHWIKDMYRSIELKRQIEIESSRVYQSRQIEFDRRHTLLSMESEQEPGD